MGVISILLGIITFFLFILGGAKLSEVIVNYKAILSMSVTSLQTVSNLGLTIAVVVFFSFLGLLIGMNLVMQGLSYNKLNKIQTQLKRRG